MRSAGARIARTRIALVACVLWLATAVGLPSLHEWTHDELAPHRHDNGSIITVSFGDSTHRHPDGTIHFASAGPHAPAAHRGRPASDGQPRLTDVAAGGHADGLAHHAAALAAPPPPVTRPLPIDRRPYSVIVARSLALVALDPLAATARGPPPVA